jgi:hypothetical protein
MNHVLKIVYIFRTLNNETSLLQVLNCEFFTEFSTFHMRSVHSKPTN